MTLNETTNHSEWPNKNLDKLAYKTTISTSRGNYSTQFKHPVLNWHSSLITWPGRPGINMTARIDGTIEKNKVISNGCGFSTIHFPKNTSNHNYKFMYGAQENENRIHDSNDCTHFSMKAIEPENTDESKKNIYPNLNKDVVGIKFVNIFPDKFFFQISNTQVQTVFSKDLDVERTLQRGMYWLRLIEVTSHLSCVNQLLIK